MDLSEMRKIIDDCDGEIINSFTRRMEAVAAVAREKNRCGEITMQPERERAIIRRAAENSPGELSAYSRRLFDVILELSKEYQSKIRRGGEDYPLTKQISEAAEHTPKIFPESARVACQGVTGAYSQLACDKIFPYAEIMYFKNFAGVFAAVEGGICEYGVLPIENSGYGAVREVYDLMRAHNVYIVRGAKLQICHALLSKPGAEFSEIAEIYSHEQAIGQCGKFLAKHPEIKVNICENTAVAARFVATSPRRDIASISSPECARLYGLSTLFESVRDEETNYTRFICISKKLQIFPGANKTSFMTATEHRPGALESLLSKFASMGINISKLESRPIPGRDFDFMFYFDLEAGVYANGLPELLGELSQSPEPFAFLGAYSEQ